MKRNIGIYIHIPFCAKKCFYCDFNSGISSKKLQSEYVDLLLKEIDLYKEKYNNFNFDTIYFGGGTPSILDPDQIIAIVNKIEDTFSPAKDVEITMEVNPETVDENYLSKVIKKINRISFGLQDIYQDTLKCLGRSNSYEYLKRLTHYLIENDFTNYSIDIMLGTPFQNVSRVKELVNCVVELKPAHISAYSLELHENTPLFEDKNSLHYLPREEEERKIYEFLVGYLDKKGYSQYEISNFCKNNFYSRHNMKYWVLDEYIGLGVSSASFIDNIRYINPHSINDYKNRINNNNLPRIKEYELNNEDILSEKCILQIRLNSGINIKKIEEEFGIDIFEKFDLQKHIDLKNIYIENGFLKLTKKGRNFSNKVEIDFL